MPDDVRAIVAADLYEADGLAWAETQAALLRRKVKPLDQLDWENIAEEIEDVGRSITRAARSYLHVVIEHLIKLEFVPQPENYGGWRRSVRAARNGLAKELSPTLRKRMPAELNEIFEEELAGLSDEAIVGDPRRIRQARPKGYSWTEVTDRDFFPEPRS